jgi:hypothetical protein
LRNDEDKSTEERRFEEVVDIPYRDPDKQPLLDAKSFKTPRLIMEYGGSHQTDGLLRLMHGYQWKQVWRDLFGRERAIVA